MIWILSCCPETAPLWFKWYIYTCNWNSPSSRATTSERELSSDMHRSEKKKSNILNNSIKPTLCYTDWPEGGSSDTHLCFGCLRSWGRVSCTHSWSCAGTQPPADPSLSSPPSCTAAAGSSSVAYWGCPRERACGLPHKSAAGEPSQFLVPSTLHPMIKINSDS